MKLIVGLGNPGEKYKNTRHNVGFLVLEELKNQILNPKPDPPAGRAGFLNPNQIPNPNFQLEKKFWAEVLKIGDVILAKPTTFMNNSGVAVSSLATFYKLHSTDIYVIHDDLDIKLGEYKIQKGVGPKLHYGVESVEKSLGTKDFWRVRVGIENRFQQIQNSKQAKISGEQYVLQNFTEEENRIIDGVLDRVIAELLNIINY